MKRDSELDPRLLVIRIPNAWLVRSGIPSASLSHKGEGSGEGFDFVISSLRHLNIGSERGLECCNGNHAR